MSAHCDGGTGAGEAVTSDTADTHVDSEWPDEDGRSDGWTDGPRTDGHSRSPHRTGKDRAGAGTYCSGTLPADIKDDAADRRRRYYSRPPPAMADTNGSNGRHTFIATIGGHYGVRVGH